MVSGLSDNQFDEKESNSVSKREAASILGGLSVRTIENYINAEELVALRKAV